MSLESPSAGRVVHFQLIVVIGRQVLQLSADVGFLHGQHYHFVIHQQLLLYRIGEVEHIELLAVHLLVIHGTQRRVVPLGRCLGHVRVDARGGGHVQALLCPDEFFVVHPDKGAFLIAEEGDSGGAIARPTSAINMYATLLDLFGIEVPAESHSQSLLPDWVPDQQIESPFIFADLAANELYEPRRVFIYNGWKLHKYDQTGAVKFYNLKKGETGESADLGRVEFFGSQYLQQSSSLQAIICMETSNTSVIFLNSLIGHFHCNCTPFVVNCRVWDLLEINSVTPYRQSANHFLSSFLILR